MKWLIIIFSPLLFCYLSGAPTFTGVDGLQRVISSVPDTMGKFNYTLGLRIHSSTSSDSIGSLINIDGYPTGPGEKGASRLIDIALGLGYSFTDYIGVNFCTAFLADAMETTIETTGSGAVSYGFSDINLGVKFAPTRADFFPFALPDGLDLGIYSTISLPTGEEREDPPTQCAVDTVFDEPCRIGEGGLHRFYTAGGVTFGIKALCTYTTQTEPEFPIHFNLGYIIGGQSKYIYGLGAELNYPPLLPFLELYGEGRVNSKYNDGGIYLTPGIHLEVVRNFWLTLAMDFRISGEPSTEIYAEEEHIQGGFGPAPAWRFNFAISQGFDFAQPSGSKYRPHR